jgi:hypothetical protein
MTRFNFTIPDDGALDELQRATRRNSKADVVRDALAVYQLLVNRARDGQKFFVGRDREHAAELTITSLEPLQREQQMLR